MSSDKVQVNQNVERHVTRQINEKSMSSDIAQMNSMSGDIVQRKLRSQYCQVTKLHETIDRNTKETMRKEEMNV